MDLLKSRSTHRLSALSYGFLFLALAGLLVAGGAPTHHDGATAFHTHHAPVDGQHSDDNHAHLDSGLPQSQLLGLVVHCGADLLALGDCHRVLQPQLTSLKDIENDRVWLPSPSGQDPPPPRTAS